MKLNWIASLYKMLTATVVCLQLDAFVKPEYDNRIKSSENDVNQQ